MPSVPFGATAASVNAELAATARSAVTVPDGAVGAIAASDALLPTRSKPFFSSMASIAAALAGISLVAGLIATVNTALIRGTTRARELHVRWMLGASDADIRRIVGLESVVVAGTGAGMGLGLATVIAGIFPSVELPAQNGVASGLPLTMSDQWWSYVVAGLVPICCTAVVLASRLGTGVAHDGARPHRLTGFVQGACLASQLAVAIGATSLTILLVKNVASLADSSRSIVQGERAVAHVDLRLHERSADQGRQDLEQLQAAAERIAGPGRVGLVSRIPNQDVRQSQRIRTDVAPDVSSENEPRLVAALSAGHGFPDAIGLPLTEGTGFGEADTASSEAVAILSDRAAHQLFGERSALGRQVQLGTDPTWLRVIGVVALGREGPAVVFRPLSQSYRPDVVVIANAGLMSPWAFGRALQKEMPQLAIFDIGSLSDEVEPGLPLLRTASLLVSFVAAFGLIGSWSALLAASRQSIALRAREILIRVALGSPLRRLYADVMKRLWIAVLAGAAAGAVSVVLAQQLFRDYLPGIEVRNATLLLAVAATCCVAALVVSAIPLRLAANDHLAVRLREAGTCSD